MKIEAIDGPCKGSFYSIEDKATFSYKAGDKLQMRSKAIFKVNPFYEDVHDIMFPQNPINPITEAVYEYQFFKNENDELYLKFIK